MKIKKMLSKMLCFSLAMSSFAIVNAKGSLSVGADFGNISSIDEATTTYDYSKKMSYTSDLLTAPTYNSLSNSINYFNNNGGGILFFFRDIKIAQHTTNYHKWISDKGNGWETYYTKGAYGRIRG